MADPLCHSVSDKDEAEEQRREAYAELDQLVVLLHEHQVLRLACDATGALAELSQLLVRDLNSEQGTQAVENLYVLLRVLGRIPPRHLQRAAQAAGQVSQQMRRTTQDDARYPPGLRGTLDLLRDDQLWQALGPALEGLKVFAEQLRQQE